MNYYQSGEGDLINPSEECKILQYYYFWPKGGVAHAEALRK